MIAFSYFSVFIATVFHPVMIALYLFFIIHTVDTHVLKRTKEERKKNPITNKIIDLSHLVTQDRMLIAVSIILVLNIVLMRIDESQKMALYEDMMKSLQSK